MIKASIYLNEEQIEKILKIVKEHKEVKLTIYECLGVDSFIRVDSIDDKIEFMESGN